MLKKHFLFFLITVTFIVEAMALVVFELIVLPEQKEQISSIIELIVQNTTGLSILMLGTVFFYLLLDIVFSLREKKKHEDKEGSLGGDLVRNQSNFVNDSTKVHKDKESNFAGALTRLLISSFSASTIPTGISLILCAFFNIELISKYMSGVGIYIAFAGFSLISIAFLSTQEARTQMTDELGIKDRDKVSSMLKKS
jgi:formate hydrogenlyase subunit 3/multisubunit Na+/H+ antiporter MnhD subunit